MSLPFLLDTLRARTWPAVLVASMAMMAAVMAPVAVLAQNDAEDRITVRSLEIRGAVAIDASRVRSVLQTEPSSRLPWGRTRDFDRRTFEADLERIRAFYVDRGYPDARVTSSTAELRSDQQSMDVTITIEEGEPLLVDEVVLENLEGLPESEIASLRKDFPIRPGEPRDQALVVNARGMIARRLQDHGYPFARVAVEERPGPAGGIALAFVARAGDPAVFGPVTVEGNASVGENVILRALAFRPGERFSLTRIQLSQRRLYDLALFRLVYVDYASENVEDGQLPMHVTVLEADHREVRFSFGYGTEELVRAESRLAHLNFFGGARTGSILGKWSSLDRGIRTEFRQPFLFKPSLSLNASVQRWFADEPAYKLHTRGGRVTVTHDLNQHDVISRRGGVASVSLSWIYEAEEFSLSTEALGDLSVRNQLIGLGLDPTTGEGAGLLNAVSIDFQRTTTTNVLDSSQGSLVQAHLERGGSFLPGDFDYVEVTLEGRHYQRLGPLGVFATRAKVGSIDGRGDDTVARVVPFFKRYLLGGSKGLRGWGRFEVAPLSGSGLPLGGHSLLELSAELRMPRTGRFGLVWFVDAGNVWVDSWDIDLSDLRYDTGPGLRVNTPIGPLRVDLAYQLTPIQGLLVNGKPEPRRWRVHLSIGQSF